MYSRDVLSVFLRVHSHQSARAKWLAAVLVGSTALGAAVPATAQDAKPSTKVAPATAGKCPADKGGLKLPPGFCATVFADKIGHARHLVVAPNGVVYVNTWSGHPMHPFVIDPHGSMYVDVASATNSCQPQNRQDNIPGDQPCTELETRGGIWLYDANKTGQVFSPHERYATGIRNADGIALDPAGDLYSTQHGRDQLGTNWSRFYTPGQGAELPAEEQMKVVKGGDYGWPECYPVVMPPPAQRLILPRAED